MKRSPLKTKPNREKKAARFARQYHSTEFVEWMKAKPCCCRALMCSIGIAHSETFEYVTGYPGIAYKIESEVSHVVSRGAGGTWKDAVPMSPACHREFHAKGRRTYCQARGWPLERLSELAAGYAAEWEARGG